jgi:hypothetical protein
MNNALLNLLLVIVLAGLVLGLINRFLPMAPFVKSLLNIVVAVVLVIDVLQFFGVIPNILPMVDWYHSSR